MRKPIIFFFTISLLASASLPVQSQQNNEVTSAYKDIRETLGVLPTFFKEYPQFSVTGAWMEMKGTLFNSSSAIPAKYKELISLAVAAQIPCRYCAYFHTEGAKVYNASVIELREAVAVGGLSRRWSTFLNGIQIDVGEFRSEIDKILMIQNNKQNLQAMEVTPSPQEIQLNTIEDVYKDIKTQFGILPNFITQYPKQSLAGAWREIKGLMLNPYTTIPLKYKDLIGLAVSAQVPCAYCIYYHTQSAIMQGATKEELEETVALSGAVRAWSSVLNGSMMDEKAFREEVNQMMIYLKSKNTKKVGKD